MDVIRCRVCLQHTYECVSLEAPLSDESEATIAEYILAISSISCNASDGLPYLICDNCMDELVRTFNFIAKIQESDTILKQEKPGFLEVFVFPTVEDTEEQIIKETEEILVTDGIIFETVDVEEIAQQLEQQPAKEKRPEQQQVEEKHLVRKKQQVKTPAEMEEQQSLEQNIDNSKATIKQDYGKVIVFREGTRMYKCSSCSKEFKRRDYLSNHIRFVHRKVRPFLCSMCRKYAFFKVLIRYPGNPR